MPPRRSAGEKSDVAIHLLGKPEVRVRGATWRFAAPPRTMPLLAYLALKRGKPVPRDTVAFTLWADCDETAARANLRRHLHYLRAALPPAPSVPWVLADGRATLQWNPAAPITLDVAVFERLSAQTTGREDAVALYAGDLCEGIDDDWLAYDRERLREMQLNNLAELSAAARREGSPDRAAGYLQQLLALDPWREDAVRALVELRYMLGDRAGALAEFERFAQRLEREFNARPMAETQAVYEAVVRNGAVVVAARDVMPPATQPSRAPLLPFAGRAAELGALRGWWARAARGEGAFALVRGEAGIGKSRLLAELKAIVEREGGRVIAGAATPGDAVPYRPVAQALLAALPLIVALPLDPLWLAVLAEIVPALRSRLPDLRSVPAVEESQERSRLFEAVFRVLAALADQRPLVLIAEDLHWADAATVALLEFLAERLGTKRALLIGSYREDEASRLHPVRAARRRLEQSACAVELGLGPIDRGAVETLVGRLARRTTLRREDAAALFARSEGHPLFLAELVTVALESGTVDDAPVPGGLREHVRARFARLSPDARALAFTAAIIGVSFDVELLRETSGWHDERIGAALSELLDRRLLRDAGAAAPGSYAFAHALIEATIYDEADERSRPARHLRVATVLEELYAQRSDGAAARIAHHFAHSSAPGRAASYYARAAGEAMRLHAYDDAVELATHGLQLAADDHARMTLLLAREQAHARRGDARGRAADLRLLRALTDDGDTATRLEVLRREAQFYHLADRRDDEARSIGELRELAERVADPVARFDAHYAQARLHGIAGRYEPAFAALEDALSAADESDDPEALTRAHLLLADVYERSGNLDRADAAIAAARTLADGTTNETLALDVLVMASRLANAHDDYDAMQRNAEQLLALARACGDRAREGTARNGLGTCALYRFDVREARRSLREAVTIFDAVGRPRGAVAARINLMLLDTRLGRWQAAVAAASEARAAADAAGVSAFREAVACAAALAAVRGGALDEAFRFANEAMTLTTRSGSGNHAHSLTALGLCEAARGAFGVARARLEDAVALFEALGRPVQAVQVRADLAAVALHSGDPEYALEQVRVLLPVLAVEQHRFEEPEHVQWLVARVLHAHGDERGALAALDAAWSWYRERLARIPDARTREAYRALSFHVALERAREHGSWP